MSDAKNGNKQAKPTKPVAKAAVSKKPNKLAKWWNETIGELRKVSWPTREEAIRMTKIVLVVVFSMAVFLGVIDFVFSKVVGAIIG